MALTKLTTDLIEGNLGGGTIWVSDPKTASFTAVAGEGYFVNTTSAAITVTLPSSPNTGDEVSIIDYGANASTNNITITSSDNIEGASDDLVLSTDKVSKTLVYSDATKGWLVTTEAGAGTAAAALPALTVDYLVVAGGGGGASQENNRSRGGGAGGAGGLRTSYGSTSGGGSVAESSLVLSTSTDYSVSIGAGGTRGIDGVNNRVGTNGGDSVFSTITSDGGGYGGGNGGDGNDGGSGGGAGSGYSGVGRTGGSGTANQGYAGGNSGSDSGGGGGGGAGAVGSNNSGGTGGAGGAGLAVSITGSSVTYATGGKGGNTGGSSAGSNGADYTGNGGGGANANNASDGGAGGSGVVILRYPDAYTISETTSPTVLSFTTDESISGEKVTTFTAGANGTIQFS